MIADQYPSLWDPQDLFAHLALWAGVPAALIGVVVAALGFYQSIKDWIAFWKSAVRAGRATKATFVNWTSAQQRAVARLFLFSIFTVAFSYMLAVLLTDVVELFARDPSGVFSLHGMENTAGVTQWPPAAVCTVIGEVGAITALALACMGNIQRLREFVTFLGVLTMGAAWLAFATIGVTAVGTIGALLIGAVSPNASKVHPDTPDILFTVTITAIAALCYAVVKLLPKVHSACVASFTAPPTSTANQVRPS